jgi:hypothetical protein
VRSLVRARSRASFCALECVRKKRRAGLLAWSASVLRQRTVF